EPKQQSALCKRPASRAQLRLSPRETESATLRREAYAIKSQKSFLSTDMVSVKRRNTSSNYREIKSFKEALLKIRSCPELRMRCALRGTKRVLGVGNSPKEGTQK